MSPFVVRWSQLATHSAVGIPSAWALLTMSVCGEASETSGLTTTRSG